MTPLARRDTPGGPACPLVLGTVQLGLAYGITNAAGMPSEEQCRAILRLARQSGITHLDTARAYGQSEERIGRFLGEEGGGGLTVWTKLPALRRLVGENPEAAALAAAVEDSVAASCRALGQNALAAILLHDSADLRLGDGAAWAALRRLKEQGRIGLLGVSVQSPTQLEAALAEPEVTAVQMPCNLLDWRWSEAEAWLARRPDVVVHLRSALLQGVLGRGRLERRPRIDIDLDAIRATLDAAAAELGRLDRVDLCLAAMRSLPWAHGVVVGVNRLDQLASNIELFQRPPLTAAERAHLAGMVPRVPAQLLDPTQWG